MTLCAQYAEEIDHHPDWSNSWNKVAVHLSTHSSKGLTALDIQMAKAMDIFALQVQVKHQLLMLIAFMIFFVDTH